ncbi:MAG TPA: TonB family protein [Terriglobales bacterium]|nr:TonB family protein [Terriglobales bacterium]
MGEATISVELSDERSKPEPVAELEIAPPPVSIEPATKDRVGGSEPTPPVASASSVEPLHASSETRRLTASIEEQVQVAVKDRPPITTEARVGDQTPLALASANVSISLEEQPRISAEARAGNQGPSAAANADLSLALEEQPRINAEALVVDQILLASTNANASAKSVTGERQWREFADSNSFAQEIARSVPQQADETAIATAPPNTQQSLRKVIPKPATNRAQTKLTANPRPAPKLAKASQYEQTSQLGPRWKPMTLAPAAKSSISSTQNPPKKPHARGYNANIWSALARRKPNAGQRGSTTVTFGIGPAGALRFVRVSRSSGNARLDQLALTTVHTAAPFPPPPVSGAAAYTIRIDFH